MIDLNKHYEGFNAAVCEYLRPWLLEGETLATIADEYDFIDPLYWETDELGAACGERICNDVFDYVAYLYRFQPFGPGSEQFADALNKHHIEKQYSLMEEAFWFLRDRIKDGEVANA